MKLVSHTETNGEAPNRSVARACTVMSAFSIDEPRLSLADLAARVGLPKATVYRLASSLVATGFMSQGEDGRYSLGFKLIELGAIVREHLDVVEACTPAIEALADATSETVMVGIADWDALEMTVVAVHASAQRLSVAPPTGQRTSIPPGCVGKALLLGLSERETTDVLARLPLTASTSRTHTDRAALADEIARAREVGFAVAAEEFLDGVSGAAVPVMFEAGHPRAAIGVIGPSVRIAPQLERIGSLARELTASLRPGAS